MLLEQYVIELLQEDLWCVFLTNLVAHSRMSASIADSGILHSAGKPPAAVSRSSLNSRYRAKSESERERRSRVARAHLIEAGVHAEPGGQRREVVRAGRPCAAHAGAACREGTRPVLVRRKNVREQKEATASTNLRGCERPSPAPGAAARPPSPPVPAPHNRCKLSRFELVTYSYGLIRIRHEWFKLT